MLDHTLPYLIRAIIVLVSLQVLSCAPSNFVISPEYKETVFKHQSLTINIPSTEISFENPDDVRDAFGESNPDSAYLSFFDQEFPKTIMMLAAFDTIRLSHQDYSWQFISQECPYIEADTIVLRLPQAGHRFPDSSHFILFMQNLTVFDYGVQFLFDPKSRSQDADFFVWDNYNGAIVYYGVYRKAETVNVRFISAKGQWAHSLGKMADAITRHSPFDRRK